MSLAGQVYKPAEQLIPKQLLSFEQYLSLIQAEAISEWRRYPQRTKRYVRFVD